MANEEKLKLGDILIKEKLLTEEQLAETLKFQKEKEIYTPLGEICVASGYLSRHELKALLKKYHKKMHLGEVLLSLGVISDKQLEEALVNQKERKMRLGELLVEMNIITEEELMEALSDHLDIPRIVPDPSLIDKSLLQGLSQKFLAASRIIPAYKDSNEVTVIFADPLAEETIKNLEGHFKGKIAPAIATREEIDNAIKLLFQNIEIGKIESSMESLELGKDLIIKDVPASPETSRVVQIVNYMITEAVKSGASDIHIEPQSSKVVVRYRIDGILHKKTDLPASMGASISSRIKALCGLDIAEKRRHQDGRIEAKVLGKEIDLRVSTYASVYGENVVIRVLHRQTHLIELGLLGFSPVNLAKFRETINYPSGIILVTGPTGSGKTTTLYASLNYLNNKNRMIITVEDPVEYTIDGVVQGKLDPKLGLTYSDFLKSMMRQDPDVIMVGEIRDADAAEATIQAALTGHKILSSFHTDDSTGALLRMMDMGIDTFLISSTVVSVVAQRLVRMICNECKEEYSPDPALLVSFQIDPDEAKNFKFFKGKGCKTCNNTGYKGRTGIHELLFVNDAIRNAILARKTSSDIRKVARSGANLIAMREDGVYKSLKGITNLEEIVRVIFHSEDDQSERRSLGELIDLCEMRKNLEGLSPKASQAGEISSTEETMQQKEISIPAPFTEPVNFSSFEPDKSTMPRVEIFRVRLKTAEAQNEIDKIATLFYEYIAARKLLSQSVEGMEVEDFMEYVISHIVRLKIRLGIEFVEIVLKTLKNGAKLYLETISCKPDKSVLMMKPMHVIYERLVEELDFEDYLKHKKNSSPQMATSA